MIKLGLTGGLGCGKSTVAELLRVSGIPVYDSDREAKRLMNTSSDLRSKIIDLFGDKAYLDETLNRSFIAAQVFGNPHLLQSLNSIVHPAVRRDFEDWATRQSLHIVAVESAILFESGLSAHLTQVIVVTAPLELRVRRVMARDQLDLAQINQRIASQMDEQQRISKADFVIHNDEKCALIPQVEGILSHPSLS